MGRRKPLARRVIAANRMLTPTLPVLLLILAASPIGVLAQNTDRESAVEAVKVGESVRLDVARIGRMEGLFLAANDSMFVLARNGESAQVQLGDIERLWVRGRSTGRGAWIGAAVGVVAGVIFGVALGKAFCSDDDGTFCTPAGIGAVTGLLFGAGGTVVGAGIGYAIPTWRLRFP